MKIPNPFCYNSKRIKAFVLGADPTNFSDHGKPVELDTVFAIGSGDARYFDPIRKNLECIGLSLLDVYVQNLVQEYLKDETAKNKDWEKHAAVWLHKTKAEFNEIDKTHKKPVLVTAERIIRFLNNYESPSAKAIYTCNYPVPFTDNLLERPIIPFYRNRVYALSNGNWDAYAQRLKRLF